MKKRKNQKKKTILKAVMVTLAVAGVGYLSYKKIPQVKNFVNGLIPSNKNAAREIKTKPFRKYETFNKKK